MILTLALIGAFCIGVVAGLSTKGAEERDLESAERISKFIQQQINDRP